MSSSLKTFFDAWGETDAGKRNAMIAGTLADGATYSDPRSGSRLKGAEITEYVGQFTQNAPGWSANVESSDEVNDYLRLRVAFGGKGPDGSTIVQHGTYFAELDWDGQITMLAGFVGASA